MLGPYKLLGTVVQSGKTQYSYLVSSPAEQLEPQKKLVEEKFKASNKRRFLT